MVGCKACSLQPKLWQIFSMFLNKSATKLNQFINEMGSSSSEQPIRQGLEISAGH
jgi:hypothetical protein